MRDKPPCLTSRQLVGSILVMWFLATVTSASAVDTPLLDDFWTRSDMSNDPGSGVLRFDIDLDGDGQPEILLANQELGGKHGDMTWLVYKYVEGSQYRFLGSLYFSRVCFQVLQKSARVEALWFEDEHEPNAEGEIQRSADLVTYVVTQTNITQTSTVRLKEADIRTKLAQMDAWRKATEPRLLGATVGKDGKFENPIWYELQTGKPAHGETNLEGLVVDPSLSPPEKTKSAAEWNEQGLMLMQQKKYDTAVLDFGNANSMTGYKNALYANNLGLALYKAQRYGEAVESLKKTIGIAPNRALAYLNLGDALMKLNRNSEARDAYTKYLDLAANSKSAPEVRKKLEVLSPDAQTADQSLLDHFVSMLKIPPDEGTSGSMPIKVFRMELDVTGDGKPELFLGTTWGIGRTGMPWAVYTPRPDGRYRPLGVIYFHYSDFYYSSNSSFLCSLIHVPNSGEPAFVYYHIGSDGIREITEESFRAPAEPLAKLNAWQKEGRPPVYVDTLIDLQTSAVPQWKDVRTETVVPSIGKLDAKVTETGECSAEKFLGAYRSAAGCTPQN